MIFEREGSRREARGHRGKRSSGGQAGRPRDGIPRLPQGPNELGIEGSLFQSTGNVILPDFRAARLLARRINEKVDAALLPERAIRAGRLNAMALIDEILHDVARLFREKAESGAFVRAIADLERALGAKALDEPAPRLRRALPAPLRSTRAARCRGLLAPGKAEAGAAAPPIASSPSRSSSSCASPTRTPPSRPSASSSTKRCSPFPAPP